MGRHNSRYQNRTNFIIVFRETLPIGWPKGFNFRILRQLSNLSEIVLYVQVSIIIFFQLYKLGRNPVHNTYKLIPFFQHYMAAMVIISWLLTSLTSLASRQDKSEQLIIWNNLYDRKGILRFKHYSILLIWIMQITNRANFHRFRL